MKVVEAVTAKCMLTLSAELLRSYSPPTNPYRMADTKPIKIYREETEDEWHWNTDWKQLTYCWASNRIDDIKYLMTKELREDWRKIKETLWLEDENSPSRVDANNALLVKIAKNWFNATGFCEHAWDYRKTTLARAEVVEWTQWMTLWPEEGEWKQPEHKVRPFNWKKHKEVLDRASLAYVESRFEDAYNWLSPQTSNLVAHINDLSRYELGRSDRVLDLNAKFFEAEDNEDQIMNHFAIAWKFLMKEANVAMRRD
jgi:hypothetical protein